MVALARIGDRRSKAMSGRISNRHPGDGSLHPILKLQRLAGNRAMLRLLQAGVVQAKLTVSAPDDAYEREADQVAAGVLRKLGPRSGSLGALAPSVQRQAQPEEEEEELIQSRRDASIPVIQRQEALAEEEFVQARPPVPLPVVQRQEEEELMLSRLAEAPAVQRQEEEEEELMLSRSTEAGVDPGHRVESRLEADRRGGQALDGELGSQLSRTFGYDFRNVHVHTGTAADQLSGQLSAEAFTYGSDVYFKSGRYRPDTEAGRFLLAHELTHVVQQGAVDPMLAEDSR